MLTRWVEKMVPLRRLTTIVVPHRGPRASLRAPKAVAVEETEKVINDTVVSKFSTMSAVQILKYGLKRKICGKKKDGYSTSCIVKELLMAVDEVGKKPVGLIIKVRCCT